MEYNPLSPEAQENPFPYYAYLRREHPVVWLDPLHAWVISRYQDVDFAIRNPQLFSSAKWITQSLGDLKPVPEVPWMIELDPSNHSRLRKLVSKAFTPRTVSLLEPRVRAIAEELLAPLRANGKFDFVRDFSSTLPVIVIAEMLGVEPDHRADFRRWSDNIVRATSRPSDEAERAAIRGTNAEMVAYFEEAIALRRREPRDDLLTALVQAEEDRQVLTAAEVLAMAILVLVAGNETTMNLLGNTVLALLTYSDVASTVRRDRSLVPQLIEEVLRYDSPVQLIFRRTSSEVKLSGTTIPADSTVFVLLGSANRDEAKFPDPDRFDLRRDAGEHLAFGFGTHYCLGAGLARLEARVSLEELLYSCPPFAGDAKIVERVRSPIVRGPKALPLAFSS
ncbi:MAG: cytochrome P450 [Deltaproteobacteria bacterium]|nr:cytochrome P450 [Deltaproteobacteria bacterium]